jgi:hypothetical protein
MFEQTMFMRIMFKRTMFKKISAPTTTQARIYRNCAATLCLMMSAMLWTRVAAADEGQFLILSAQYGNQYNHIDVTDRLKGLASHDVRFRLDYKVFGDPAPGQAKALRIFARGPEGRERMFEYQDGSIIDGAQFIGWGNGQWGRPGDWSGNWNGGGGGDVGQFLILSAQYGNRRRHIDVTDRLRDLARTNLQYRVDYKTFGDPAPGQAKALRIYARGPNGRERMFEYQDNSIIDGAQFRGWGSGQWGGPNDRWSGRWDPR